MDIQRQETQVLNVDNESSVTSSFGLPIEDKLTDTGYQISAFFLLAIGVIGSVSNVSVFVIMATHKELRTPMNLLLLNLACSDFGICIIGTPFSFLAAIHHGWYFRDFICDSYAFLMLYFGICSITTLSVLSFERYLIISRPISGSNMDKKTSIFVIFSIWFYSAIVATPTLVGWGQFDLEGPGINCSVDWKTNSLNNTSYIIYIFVLGLGIPLGVMGFSLSNLILTVRQSTKREFQTSASKAESRVAIMVFVMGVAFLFAWIPYAVVALLMAFGNPNYVTPGAAAAPAIFAKSSCIYNPIIYVGLNTQFRSAWRELFFGKREEVRGNTTVQQSITLIADDKSPLRVSPLSRIYSRSSRSRNSTTPKTLINQFNQKHGTKLLNIDNEISFVSTDMICSEKTKDNIELQVINRSTNSSENLEINI